VESIAVVPVVQKFRKLDVIHDAVLIMGVETNLAVMVSALSAFPWVRNSDHKCVVFQTIIIFSSEARPVAYLNVTIVSSVGSA
jgi:hypothetical protein